MRISSSKGEGEKVKTEETSTKCKIVLQFEIHKRTNKNTHAEITMVETILYTLNSNLAAGCWQHRLKFPIPARHCSMSTGLLSNRTDPVK